MENAKSLEPLQRTVRIGSLLDLYGTLLTNHQREFLHLHYNEDLSFGEIALEYNISRQAVYDAVRNGESMLEHYEEKLGYLAQTRLDALIRIREIVRRLLDDVLQGNQHRDRIQEQLEQIIMLAEKAEHV